MSEQVPPQDLDAERALLGAILMRAEEVFEPALEIITTPEALYLPAHRAIWSLLVALQRDGKPIDFLIVRNEIEAQGLGDKVNPEYLVQLAECFADWVNVPHYARLVQEAYRKRLLIRAARDLAEAAYNPIEKSQTVAAQYAGLLDGISADSSRGRVRDAVDVMAEAPDRWASRSSGYLPSGICSFDERIGGLPLGEQVVVAARPSVGKTALGGVYWALHAAREGHNALLFSVEMREDRIADRFISNLAGRPASTIRKYDSPEDQQHYVRAAIDTLGRGRLWLSDSLRTEQRIVAAARSAIRRHKIELVVIDYLQLCRPSDRHDSRTREVGAMAEAFKAIAQDTGVCVITVSQLNREAERSNREPNLFALRDSGEIEQHADVVVFLHRTSPNDGRTVDELTLIVAKNRNGATARFERVRFNKPLMRFSTA